MQRQDAKVEGEAQMFEVNKGEESQECGICQGELSSTSADQKLIQKGRHYHKRCFDRNRETGQPAQQHLDVATEELKEAAEEEWEDVKQVVGENYEAGKKAAGETIEGAKEKANVVVGEVSKKAGEAKEALGETVQAAQTQGCGTQR